MYTAPRFVYLLALLFAGHLYISTSFTPTPRASGDERSMLFLGGSMRRLNAHGRSSTVRSQRPQPTGAVDLALEPLTFACAHPPRRHDLCMRCRALVLVCRGFASVCIAPPAAPCTPSLCRDINIFAAFFSSLPRGCGRAILRVVGEGPDVNLNRRGAASSNLLPPLPILLACYS